MVARARAPSFTITGPFAHGLNDQDNLVTHAVAAFRATHRVHGHQAIVLEKRLPIASGIGGGSADAAATLRGLGRLYGISPNNRNQMLCAASLGADVPACLVGQTAFGAGRGDELEPLPPLGDVPALLVNPGVAVSTAAVFAGWDGVDRGPLPREGGTLERARGGRNDLAAPAISLAPTIAGVLAALERLPGVTFSRMSGSGATCFALFGAPADRRAAAAALRVDRPGWWVMETALV